MATANTDFISCILLFDAIGIFFIRPGRVITPGFLASRDDQAPSPMDLLDSWPGESSTREYERSSRICLWWFEAKTQLLETLCDLNGKPVAVRIADDLDADRQAAFA